MESIIVVIIVMRIQVNVQLVTMPVISDVTMGNVFQEVLDGKLFFRFFLESTKLFNIVNNI